MGDEFWQVTSQMFSSLFEKPKMTEKLLSKPPFKYLFDIVTQTTKVSKFTYFVSKSPLRPLALVRVFTMKKSLVQIFMTQEKRRLTTSRKLLHWQAPCWKKKLKPSQTKSWQVLNQRRQISSYKVWIFFILKWVSLAIIEQLLVGKKVLLLSKR